VGPGIIAAWFVVMITQAHSTQAVVQIGFACRDERAASRAYLLGGLLIFPVGFISAVIGLAARVLHPDIVAAEALPRVVLELPPAAAGLVLAGLWAADVSTASALLIGSATLVSHDVVKRLFAPGLSERADQLVCRITVLGLSAVTLALAMTVQGILTVLLIGLTLSTAYTLVVLATLLVPRLCRRSSATWTLLATMAAVAAWLATPARLHVVPHPIYLTWAVSLAAFLLVAALDRRRLAPARPGT
jgi:SSS family solute:Na+ symporter